MSSYKAILSICYYVPSFLWTASLYNYRQRAGYWRSGGFLAQKLNRITTAQPCTNAQSKNVSRHYANTLLSAAPFSVALVVGRLSVGKSTLFCKLWSVRWLCAAYKCVCLCVGIISIYLQIFCFVVLPFRVKWNT